MLDFLVPDPRGRLVTNPSHSPENAFFAKDGSRAKFTYGATMDLEIVHDLFVNTIAAAERLGVDSALRTQLAAALRRLAPAADQPERPAGCRSGSRTTRRSTPATGTSRTCSRSIPASRSPCGGRPRWPPPPARAWSTGWPTGADAPAGAGGGSPTCGRASATATGRYESLKALLAENTSDALAGSAPAGDLPDGRQRRGHGGDGRDAACRATPARSSCCRPCPRPGPRARCSGLRARGNFGVDLRWEAGAL